MLVMKVVDEMFVKAGQQVMKVCGGGGGGTGRWTCGLRDASCRRC